MTSLETIAKELLQRDDFLVLAHERADGDAVGSLLGMRALLRFLGKRVRIFRAKELPSNLSAFFPPDDGEDFAVKTVVYLDCASSSRIAGPGAVPGAVRINVDHHANNDVEAEFHHIDSSAPATCVLCAELAKLACGRIPGECATFFMLGLLTDTGGFRFSNTTNRAFQIASELLDAGADYQMLINLIFFEKPRRRQLFEADLCANYVKSACDGKYVYAVIPQELFDKYHFSMRDGEGVIDVLREIEGSVIAALLYEKDGAVKISLRSKEEAYPVLECAQSLGGGGHKMASGITLRGVTPDRAAGILEQKIAELLKP